MPSKKFLNWTVLFVSAVLAGCGTTTSLDEASKGAPVESRSPVPLGSAGGAAAGGATAASTPQSKVATVDLDRAGASGAGAGAAGAAAAGTAQRIVYFDFDSFVIKDEYKGLIEGHAKALSTNRNKTMVIEGHTDERGGREYNLALGQKRAESVAKALALLGAREGQIEAVSFGEERPAVQGGDESTWARNRRAELKDR